MLNFDKGSAFPGLGREPNWSVFLLCPPFAKHVFDWFCSHEWVQDDRGFSILEF